jgi:hypothetical protein
MQRSMPAMAARKVRYTTIKVTLLYSDPNSAIPIRRSIGHCLPLVLVVHACHINKIMDPLEICKV